MSTRSGDLDPGLSHYLAQTAADERGEVSTHGQSRVGIARCFRNQLGHARPARARDRPTSAPPKPSRCYCYQAKKWIGAFAAALGGVDTLVFAGGIGENAPLIRERICASLGFLGIELDAARNAESAALISAAASRVTVRVIRTDEELMLARSALPFCSRLE